MARMAKDKEEERKKKKQQQGQGQEDDDDGDDSSDEDYVPPAGSVLCCVCRGALALPLLFPPVFLIVPIAAVVLELGWFCWY